MRTGRSAQGMPCRVGAFISSAFPICRRRIWTVQPCEVPIDGAPIVALTLRYDRIDNFWFSLLHELAHVGRHFNGAMEAFVDDFSLREAPSRHEDTRENEADEWAEEALIPADLGQPRT